jgi:hypothetical protein
VAGLDKFGIWCGRNGRSRCKDGELGWGRLRMGRLGRTSKTGLVCDVMEGIVRVGNLHSMFLGW